MSFDINKLVYLYLRFSIAPLYALSIFIMTALSVEVAAYLAIRVSVAVMVFCLFGLGLPQLFLKISSTKDYDLVNDAQWVFIFFGLSILAGIFVLLLSYFFYKIEDSVYLASHACVYFLYSLQSERYRVLRRWRQSSFFSPSIDAHLVLLSILLFEYDDIKTVLLFINLVMFLCYFLVVFLSGVKVSLDRIHLIIVYLKNSILTVFYFWISGVSLLFFGEGVVFTASHFGDEAIVMMSLGLKLGVLITLPLLMVMSISGPELSVIYQKDRARVSPFIYSQGKKITFISTPLFLLVLVSSYFYAQRLNVDFWVLVPLLVAAYINSITGLCSMYLNISGNEVIVFKSQLVAGAISLFLAFVSILFNNLYVLSLGSCLATVVANLWMFRSCLRLNVNTSGIGCKYV